MFSSGINAQSGIFAHGCSDNYITELNEKQANEFQQQRFNNEINNDRQNKILPTLVTTRKDELKYFYLRSSCRQVA